MLFELNFEGLAGVIKGEESSKEERTTVYMVLKLHNAFREIQAKGECSKWLENKPGREQKADTGFES